MSKRKGSQILNIPYVILLGDVGQGKSTLVEKVTEQKGRSSASDESETRSAEAFHVYDRSLVICDTPGSNPIDEKFKHNAWIADAITRHPVSRILIVVKADTRIDKVIDEVRKYAEGFLDFWKLLGVCVTHMDMISWDKEKFKRHLNQELGIEIAVFSGLSTSSISLLWDIKASCGKPMDVTITSENFLNYFKISNNNLKIIRSVKRETTELETIKRDFFEALQTCPQNDKVDLIFQFQTWVAQEIIDAQIRVSEENDFTFIGYNIANESGHIANMTRQLRTVLYDVRTRALAYQSSHGISQMRKCPHCELIWAKIEGCNGATTCGNRIASLDGRKGELATFTFLRIGGKLTITRTGQRKIERKWGRRGQNENIGCGKPIEWNAMAPVEVPDDFNVISQVSTKDVKLIPKEAEKTWRETFTHMMSSVATKIF